MLVFFSPWNFWTFKVMVKNASWIATSLTTLLRDFTVTILLAVLIVCHCKLLILWRVFSPWLHQERCSDLMYVILELLVLYLSCSMNFQNTEWILIRTYFFNFPLQLKRLICQQFAVWRERQELSTAADFWLLEVLLFFNEMTIDLFKILWSRAVESLLLCSVFMCSLYNLGSHR